MSLLSCCPVVVWGRDRGKCAREQQGGRCGFNGEVVAERAGALIAWFDCWAEDGAHCLYDDVDVVYTTHNRPIESR